MFSFYHFYLFNFSYFGSEGRKLVLIVAVPSHFLLFTSFVSNRQLVDQKRETGHIHANIHVMLMVVDGHFYRERKFPKKV